MSRSWARLTGLTGRVWSSGEMLQGGSGLWTGWQRERQGVGESHVVNTYPVRCGNKVVFSGSGSSIRRFTPSLQCDRSKVCLVRPSSNINILPRFRGRFHSFDLYQYPLLIVSCPHTLGSNCMVSCFISCLVFSKSGL